MNDKQIEELKKRASHFTPGDGQPILDLIQEYQSLVAIARLGQKMRGTAWKVTVRTTNPSRDNFTPKENEGYYACEGGAIIVITDDPREIIDFCGDAFLGMERINVGYALRVR